MKPQPQNSIYLPKPQWISVPAPSGENVASIRELKNRKKLHTVYESALCPNMGTYWNAGQATFMIMGNG